MTSEQAIALPWCFLPILKLCNRGSAGNSENFTSILNADPSLWSIIAVCVHAFVLADFNKRCRLCDCFCELTKLDAVFG